MRQSRVLPCLLVGLVSCARPVVDDPEPQPPPEPTHQATAPATATATATAAAPKLDSSPIADVARSAIARGDVAGAVILVLQGGEVVFQEAYGLRQSEPSEAPMTLDTVFDLASLTKVIATAPSIALLVEQKKLRLGDKVARYLPAFGANGKEDITIEQLLLHTSGLPDDNALRDYERGPAEALARVYAQKPLAAPGERFRYSDLGFIVLGALVEKVAGEPLDVFVQKHFYAPLGMKDTSYRPRPALAARAAPTEREGASFRKGEVHDPRARALGGVAGHAGLFSTAGDLARFAQMLLDEGQPGEARGPFGARVLSKASVIQMTAPRSLPGDAGKRGLGWDIDTSFSGPRGDLQGGYGHTGFTGTSIWIAPRERAAVIVLTSRLYPDGRGDPRRLRREVASLVAHTLKAPLEASFADPFRGPPAPGAAVLTGVDVLERDQWKPLQGRRIGLVTHAAGINRKGTSTIDLLRGAPGVTLVALFSPEHGLRSEQDRKVADGRDPRTGLPVHSLYGEHTRPDEAALQGIDTLVYDLQDVGARFFTYTTTLGYLLEAAAPRKIKVVVLDRPNPIGGLAVEGPVLEQRRTSFTGYHPLPVRHGMTAGEMALLLNHERGINADLTVIRVEGWRRGDTFDRTGLPWVNPSPNLRSVIAAMLYPGVALLEATNVSVGRGTDRPFERVGAPFIDGGKLAAALAEASLPGVRFTATSFTPTTSTHEGKLCFGVEIRIDEPARFEPVRAGLTLARALLRLYPGDFQARNILLLLGDEPTFTAITRGDPIDRVIAGFQPGLDAFLKVRETYLLYPASPPTP